MNTLGSFSLSQLIHLKWEINAIPFRLLDGIVCKNQHRLLSVILFFVMGFVVGFQNRKVVRC
jgi:hypothetical protein